MSKQDIIDRIRKVKRLAEDGIEGEKEAEMVRRAMLMSRGIDKVVVNKLIEQ